MTLYLTESDVERTLSMPEIMEAVELGMRELGQEKATNNPRMRVQTKDHVLNVLTAGTQTAATFGLKSYTTLMDGTQPSSTLVWIYDANTGSLDAIVQATLLTRMRTGAASALATRYLAKERAKSIGLVGAGKIGEMQLEALLQDARYEKVSIYDSVEQASTKLVDAIGTRFSIDCQRVGSVTKLVENSDIIVTATFSDKPVIEGRALHPGVHINAVGSNSPARAEIDGACFGKARAIVVDFKEQCKVEAGDLMRAVEAKETSWDKVIELSDLVAGNTSFVRKEDDITIFKSVGIAIEDIIVSRKLCDKARELQIGREISIA